MVRYECLAFISTGPHDTFKYQPPSSKVCLEGLLEFSLVRLRGTAIASREAILLLFFTNTPHTFLHVQEK
jgi:hypothetical protein